MEPAEGAPLIAVVGCGRWGAHVVRDLLVLGCRVVAVDRDPAARIAALAAGAAGAAPALQDAPTVDGVIIAAPTTHHVSLALEAADRGVPVFVEKPLSDDPDEARRLVELAGNSVFVMHKWQYHPGIQALARLAASGRLGTLTEVRSWRVGRPLPSPDTDAIWLLAPHELTIGCCIVGAWPEHTSATLHTVGDAIDLQVGNRWAGGAQHHWRISTAAGPTERGVVVVGTEGRATLDGAYAASIVLGDGSTVPFENEAPLLRELRAFRDHLLGGPPPPTTAADGLRVVEIIAELRTKLAR